MGGVMVSLAGTLRFLMGSLSKPGYTEKLLAYRVSFWAAPAPVGGWRRFQCPSAHYRFEARSFWIRGGVLCGRRPPKAGGGHMLGRRPARRAGRRPKPLRPEGAEQPKPFSIQKVSD
jgi:hypothetical protein